MKNIHVSAAVIFRTTDDGTKEVFATARGYGDYKAGGNFPAEKSSTMNQATKLKLQKKL